MRLGDRASGGAHRRIPWQWLSPTTGTSVPKSLHGDQDSFMNASGTMTSVVYSHSTHLCTRVAEFQEGGVCKATAAHTEQGPQVTMPGCPGASAAGSVPPTQAQAVDTVAQASCPPQPLGPQCHRPDILKRSEDSGPGILMATGTLEGQLDDHRTGRGSGAGEGLGCWSHCALRTDQV